MNKKICILLILSLFSTSIYSKNPLEKVHLFLSNFVKKYYDYETKMVVQYPSLLLGKGTLKLWGSLGVYFLPICACHKDKAQYGWWVNKGCRSFTSYCLLKSFFDDLERYSKLKVLYDHERYWKLKRKK